MPIRKSDLAYSTLEDKQILGKKTDQVESSPEDEVHKEFDDMTEAGDVDEWEEAVYGNRKDSEVGSVMTFQIAERVSCLLCVGNHV